MTHLQARLDQMWKGEREGAQKKLQLGLHFLALGRGWLQGGSQTPEEVRVHAGPALGKFQSGPHRT